MPDQATVTRIRAEFLEMHGMRLTFDQTRRLCGVEPALCQIALDALVDEKFLFVGSDGGYGRLTDRETHDRRSSKVCGSEMSVVDGLADPYDAEVSTR